MEPIFGIVEFHRKSQGCLRIPWGSLGVVGSLDSVGFSRVLQESVDVVAQEGAGKSERRPNLEFWELDKGNAVKHFKTCFRPPMRIGAGNQSECARV